MIIRKHGLMSDLFSCLVFNELQSFNPRDQLAFAFVRDSMRPKLRINMFDVEVFEQVATEYRHNLKRHDGGAGGGGGGGPASTTSKSTENKKERTRRGRPPNSCLPVNGSCWGRCEKYLSQMWS